MSIYKIKGINTKGKPFQGVPQLGILLDYKGEERWVNGPRTGDAVNWIKGQDIDIDIMPNGQYLNFTIKQGGAATANNKLGAQIATVKQEDDVFGKCKFGFLQEAFTPFLKGELMMNIEDIEHQAEEFTKMAMRKL